MIAHTGNQRSRIFRLTAAFHPAENKSGSSPSGLATGDQTTPMISDVQDAHLTQAALAVFGGFPPFLRPSRCDPNRVVFDPNRLSGEKWRISAVFGGIGWDRFLAGFRRLQVSDANRIDLL
ncbi:hypothetical protein [Sphingomonas sp. Leaf37]|uniref:hypothetical protein n=1 Tax=Sphingomonas sp. Leaf37 TaxID=2876552 RepID=UPI001E5F0844|nr:hypothetical protein [Sphingomonas sp. Leaf37]